MLRKIFLTLFLITATSLLTVSLAYAESGKSFGIFKKRDTQETASPIFVKPQASNTRRNSPSASSTYSFKKEKTLGMSEAEMSKAMAQYRIAEEQYFMARDEERRQNSLRIAEEGKRQMKEMEEVRKALNQQNTNPESHIMPEYQDSTPQDPESFVYKPAENKDNGKPKRIFNTVK